MDFSYLFEPYNDLVSKADQAFEKVAAEYPDCVKCKPHCSDCCHAVFGLFLIEAYFLKHDFDQLSVPEKEAALIRANAADREILRLETSIRSFEGDPEMQSYAMAKARIRCPLLSDNNECIVYNARPITCRAYGIPTLIQGKPRVCGQADFTPGPNYPVFNIGSLHKGLFQLTKDLLASAGIKDMERASLLLSVSKIIKTPVEDLMGISTQKDLDK